MDSKYDTMKISEIIVNESSQNPVKTGIKPDRDQERAMPGVHRVAGTADRTYDLNRTMMAVACADGVTEPVLPEESWAGRNNIAAPYSKQEHEMLKHAYRAVGSPWQNVLDKKFDKHSMEPGDTNTVSPFTKKMIKSKKK